MGSSTNTNSSFTCTRVNPSTFLVHEKDHYEEHPFIYVKTYKDHPVLVLSDTGCGGGNDKQLHASSLKDFLECSQVTSNDGRPLNPRDSSGKATKRYVIICTHCHYDHILGLPFFKDESPDIVASLGGKDFIESDLPEHSLCKSLNISTPKYTVTTWAHDHQKLFFDERPLYVEIIHTPGHTPDEVAWYDSTERHLYVGDTLYERVAADTSYEQAILFPKEGNIIDYLSSLGKLLLFVDAKNEDMDAHRGRLKIGCGHITSSVDARETLLAVQQFFMDILQDKIPIVETEEKRGETYATWRLDEDKARFSVTAPERIMQLARQSRKEADEHDDVHR